ncbi:ATP12 family chaperone protein [Sphingomicrobium aestuariivivum]|uniref:ATP12 family chaperone protein n=1 Tax=Sphingomicrobium aestuariivivum TaxID=1582356 RepID=UPI001FD6E619|nr:ATP12 family protein [Sphingomicrobium aestuariivivum]MCJ8191519.1 ATPase [Sphingomicrobium aestuariivivum]
MKRFWKDVSVEEADGGWTVRLDERVLKTPARGDLVVPTETLAEAIAEEWRAVEEKIDPRAMPMTGLANAAIDRVAVATEAFAAELGKYAEGELCCYRADYPTSLVDLQAAQWDPLLDWAAARYDVSFEKTSGIMHVDQPPATLERLKAAVHAEDAFVLAALSPMIRNGGSLVTALAVRHGALEAEKAWDATDCDRRHQAEQWGTDEEGEKAAAAKREDFLTGARFLQMLEG